MLKLFIRQKGATGKGCIFGIYNYICLKVKHPFQVLQSQIQEITHLGGKTLQKPYMGYRGCEFNVAHTFAANFALDHFHAALLTLSSSVFHPLVLSAVTFVILDGSKDF